MFFVKSSNAAFITSRIVHRIIWMGVHGTKCYCCFNETYFPPHVAENYLRLLMSLPKENFLDYN
jgi:hypothetical protein